MSTERTIDATKTSPSTSVAGDARMMALSSDGTFQPVTLDTLISLVRDNIQIGGRNLLKGTSDEWASMLVTKNAGLSSNIPLDSLGLRAGDPVVFSIQIKPSAEGKILRARLEFYETDNNRTSWISKEIVTDENEVLILSGVVPAGYSSLRWCIDANDSSDTVTKNTMEYFKAVKLERGNIPTDWTPAPEDVADLLANRGGVKSTLPTCYTSCLQSAEKGVQHERKSYGADRSQAAFISAKCSDKARNGDCWIEFEYGHSARLLFDSRLGYRESSHRHAKIRNTWGIPRILSNAHDCPDAKSVPFHSFTDEQGKRHLDKVDKVLRRISLTPGKEVVAA